jgi:hypothetical protein
VIVRATGNGQTYEGKSDRQGKFRIEAAPGLYDLPAMRTVPVRAALRVVLADSAARPQGTSPGCSGHPFMCATLYKSQFHI